MSDKPSPELLNARRRFKAYPAYKDSGVEWLGEIPAHWEVKRLKTIAAFLNSDGGDLLVGVAEDGTIVGTEQDHFESDDAFLAHLAEVVRVGLGDRAAGRIDAKMHIAQGKTVCLVSCQRSPEPVHLRWKGVEASSEGDFFVRSGSGTVRLPPESVREYVRTRFDRKR